MGVMVWGFFSFDRRILICDGLDVGIGGTIALASKFPIGPFVTEHLEPSALSLVRIIVVHAEFFEEVSIHVETLACVKSSIDQACHTCRK